MTKTDFSGYCDFIANAIILDTESVGSMDLVRARKDGKTTHAVVCVATGAAILIS